MPLSLIPATQLIDELNSDPEFASRSDEEKLRIISSAEQEVCNADFANGRENYKVNNFEVPLGVTRITHNLRIGSGVATIAGTFVTFMVDGVPTPLADADYAIAGLAPGVSFEDPTTHADSRTVDGFRAYSAIDGVGFTYVAGEPT